MVRSDHTFRFARYPGTNRGWLHSFACRPVQMLVWRSADEQPRRPGNLEVSRWHEALVVEYSQQSSFLRLADSASAFQDLSENSAVPAAAGLATNRGGRTLRDLRDCASVA